MSSCTTVVPTPGKLSCPQGSPGTSRVAGDSFPGGGRHAVTNVPAPHHPRLARTLTLSLALSSHSHYALTLTLTHTSGEPSLPGIVYVQEAERQIPIVYASKYRAGGLARRAYLPFKVNSSGVMPIIFASPAPRPIYPARSMPPGPMPPLDLTKKKNAEKCHPRPAAFLSLGRIPDSAAKSAETSQCSENNQPPPRGGVQNNNTLFNDGILGRFL